MRIGALVVFWTASSAALAVPSARAEPDATVSRSPRGAPPIVLHERTPLGLLVSSPTGDPGRASSSELIRLVSAEVEAHTDFFVQLADPQVATDCRGHLGCVVLQLRAPVPRYFLVLSSITAAGEADRLSALLLDTERALASAAEAASGEADRGDSIDAHILDRALVLGPERTRVANDAEAEGFIRRLFAERLSRVFADSKDWEPYGAIELQAKGGLALSLDGVPIGSTAEGKTTILGVTAGPRRLLVEQPGFEPVQLELSIERRKTTITAATLKKPNAALASSLRRGLLYTGLGAAGAGLVLTGIAIARHDGDSQALCLSGPGTPACRTGSSFETAGYSPNAPLGSDVNPAGVRLAPLGYSLAAAGGTWAAATELFGADDEIPWIQLVVGVAVGTLSYGLSAALDHR